jgi:aminoglycoside phosphotransferase (APT) family kinase protein
MSDEAYERPQVSSRDQASTLAALQAWITTKLTDPVVSDLIVPPGNGMSSETLLFEVESGPPDDRLIQSCVLRLPPSAKDLPVFPSYDLGKQAAVMELAGSRAGIPVPAVLWYESDPAYLGAEFIVMQRIIGRVPPDVMPYVFPGNWLYDESTDEQRARLSRRTVEVIAALHDGVYTPDELAALGPDRPGDTSLRRHFNDLVAYYDWVRSDGIRSPLIEHAFATLDAAWPHAAAARSDVLSWGDSRIGNVMYGKRYEPVAILDWEMAARGPRELDLGWLIYMHRFFQSVAEVFELPGLPTLLDRAETAAQYEAASGVQVLELDWFLAYAALRYAIVAFRIARRQVHFGEIVMPDDPDALIMNASSLNECLARL